MIERVAGLLVAGCMALAGTGPARAASQPGAPGDAAAVIDATEEGSSLYRHTCARCHGSYMNNPASGVFDLRTFPRDDPARFTASVKNGKGAMPAWAGTLTDGEIEALRRYVSAEPASAP